MAPEEQNHSCVLTEVGDALNVSVMSLSGEVLVTVLVSSRISVWELKGLIENRVPSKHMKAACMTLMLGSQVLADAASLHDAGVVDGTSLSIVVAPKFKLLVCKFRGAMELWSQEGNLERTFLTTTCRLLSAEFSPDNTYVLTRECDSAKLWRVDTQGCLFIFSHETHLLTAAFSPTGSTVLTTSIGHDAKLWSVSSGHCISNVQFRPFGLITPAFTAHGGMLLHTYHGCISLWNMETGARVWEYPHCYRRGSARFSAHGDWFLTISGPCNVPTNVVDLWSVASCSHDRQLKEPNGEIRFASFSPDGWRVVTVSSRNTARVWSLGRDWVSCTFQHENQIESADFFPDGVQILIISRGDAWLWIPDGQAPGRRLPQRHVSVALFDPQSEFVLLSGCDGIAMWNATGTELCWAHADNGMSLTALAFSH